MYRKNENGRTLFEMILVIILITLISFGTYGVFKVLRFRSRLMILEKELTRVLIELRHKGMTKKGITESDERLLKGSQMNYKVIVDEFEPMFILRVGTEETPLLYEYCEKLMESDSFAPTSVFVQGSEGCKENMYQADFRFDDFRNRPIEEEDEDEEEARNCRYGICQSCTNNGGSFVRTNLPSGTACESAGVAGECDGNGICYPQERNTCNGFGSCPEGEFCNYGGTYDSGAQQSGRFGKTPNVCQEVNPKIFTYIDPQTNEEIIFYYNSYKDLKSWCRAADNDPNCTWGYLAYYGARDWCNSLDKRLLTNAEFKQYEEVLKTFLPKTMEGYSYWVDGGAYNPNSSNAYSGRLDGYAQTGGVVCR